MSGLARLFIAFLALGPSITEAHGFGRLYNLPVPFWLYGWAAAAALVVSFVLAAWFAAEPAASIAPAAISTSKGRDLAWICLLHHLRPVLRALAVFLLWLCIATGLFGNIDPFHNFSMTFFWVVFVLGCTYFTAVFGNAFAVLNPWLVTMETLGRLAPGLVRGRLRYRKSFGDWPALALYLAFIGFELFSRATPSSLALLLLAYTAINFAGVWLIGIRDWFAHGEFFSVFLRLVSLHSPVDYRRTRTIGADPVPGSIRARAPFAGLVQERPRSLSTVVFALAMLGTTAFDGLRATQWWVRLFWADPSGLVTALLGAPPIEVPAQARALYVGWEMSWLVVSPFLYFGAYLICLAMAKRLARSTRTLRDLALDFGYTLLPIALVYHLTHYATLLLTQGLKILNLVSDPFGRGWNLFGTTELFRAPILPGMGLVWHTQVGLILFGHIVSVCVAHRVALKVMPSRRQALLSQLPMLVLMVAFTVAGLWILAQPLTVEMMR